MLASLVPEWMHVIHDAIFEQAPKPIHALDRIVK
jgi:hypothetical protein